MIFVLNQLRKKEYYKYLKRRQRYQLESFYEIARFFNKCEKTIQIHKEIFDLSIFSGLSHLSRFRNEHWNEKKHVRKAKK
mgnify:CR=1 FL=1